MRNVLLILAVSMFAIFPLEVQAQEGSLKAKGKAAPPEEEGEEAAPEGSATIAPEGSAGVPGSQHTVERGDTLWDLSQRYLGSPWYWPKVWSYNAEIANPHWIYPGNLVRFFPTGEEVPTQVEVGAGPEDVEEVPFVPDDDDRVSVSGPIGFVPKKAITLQATGFVTPNDVEETGSITGSFAESEMLSFPQTAYVEFKSKKSARLGETFIVFRSQGEVRHPVTGGVVGYLTKILGSVKVVRIEKNGVATVVFEKEFHDIRRGDLIGPMGEALMHSVGSRPNDRDVKDGVIVASTTTYLATFGEHQILIIDKGSDDGVKTGNIFNVWRQHDAAPQEIVLNPTIREERWPKEDVGACMAFEVKQKATTCLVTKSIRELVRGDRLEMRAAGSRTSAR